MLCLLSPAKTLKREPVRQLARKLLSEPVLADQTQVLVDMLCKASEHKAQFQQFFDQKQLVGGLMYDGPAFKKLNAEAFSEDDFVHAQHSLIVLSGLYGCVRPLDQVRPYRLEMAAKVDGTKLVDFWKAHSLNDTLVHHVQQNNVDFVVNCASVEYSSVVDFAGIEQETSAKVVHVVFTSAAGRLASVHAKQARGSIARHIVVNRCKTLDDLRAFTGDDANAFEFRANESDDQRLVFARLASAVAPPKGSKKRTATTQTKSATSKKQKPVTKQVAAENEAVGAKRGATGTESKTSSRAARAAARNKNKESS